MCWCVENVDGLSKRERGLGRDREKKKDRGGGVKEGWVAKYAKLPGW